MPSPAYFRALEEAKLHHQRSKTYSGKFLRPHKRFLSPLIMRLDIRSALDYGCGKGLQYEWADPADGDRTLEQAWGFPVVKYDPAWPAFEIEPSGRFDLVICTHVLGSIPIVDLPWALERIMGFATKAVYFAEKLGPVKKTALSDPGGRPVDWPVERWLGATASVAAGFSGEVHFSFARKTANGVQTERYRFLGSDWLLVQ